MTGRRPAPEPADRVTAVETFFDVVFAFTLTQLTRTLEHDLSLAGVGRLLLVFAALWYMYGGYAWLTNHVPPHRSSHKLVLFVGMAGMFIAAIAIPHAFDGAGVLFGVGYLLVVAVHLVLFMQSDVREVLARLAPFNLAGASLVLAAGFARGGACVALWIAGVFVMTVLPYLVPRWSWVRAAGDFHVAAEHFVERHGILVVLALGESVIALGMGVDASQLTLPVVGLIVLALAVPGALWWTYFTDARAAESALGARGGAARSMFAMRAYYFVHIPILLGVVLAAAGVHAVIAHPEGPVGWPWAIALSGGVALFLVGVAELRRAIGISAGRSRVLASVAVLATTPLGALVSGGLELVAVLAVLLVLTLPERRTP